MTDEPLRQVIRRLRIAIAVEHGCHDLDGLTSALSEDSELKKNFKEAAWYQTVTHFLTSLFDDNPFITVNPQGVLIREVFSDSRDGFVEQKLVPDFVVFLSPCHVNNSNNSIVLDGVAPILVVEVKPTPIDDDRLDETHCAALAQVHKQVQQVFAKWSKQKSIGAMVCVGKHWTFSTFRRDDIKDASCFTDDNYSPGDDTSESQDNDLDAEISEEEIRKILIMNDLIQPIPSMSTPAPSQKSGRAVTRTRTRKNSTSGANRSNANAGVKGLVVPTVKKKEPLKRLDPEVFSYNTFGTEKSEKAAIKMHNKLVHMPGFDSRPWIHVYKSGLNQRDFNRFKAMFDEAFAAERESKPTS